MSVKAAFFLMYLKTTSNKLRNGAEMLKFANDERTRRTPYSRIELVDKCVDETP